MPQPEKSIGMVDDGAMPTTGRNFLEIAEFDAETLRSILAASRRMKTERSAGGGRNRPLDGRVLAMIFESPSTRTRVSFDVAMRQLGGETLVLSGSELQLGRGETIADTAKVLSRYVDAIMIRILSGDALAELAREATVPVINGLTRLSHPCQIMADIMTFEEHRGPIAGRTIAWSGDANNVLTSWIEASARLGFKLRAATPPEMPLADGVRAFAAREDAGIVLTADPEEAVDGADCVVTDAWVSMGDDEAERRHNILRRYQVDKKLMARAADDAIFMHCLPAHRGEEVTADVIDGPQSVVFDEAENRLHAQKGILAWCLGLYD